jgi:acetylornithine deacetylase/succinyl-diaminopimelate desuccinylase-like protein
MDARFNSLLRTTCVATRLNAGHANNALPQHAQAIVNCRILPGHAMEEVRQKLVQIFADPKIDVKYVDNSYRVFDRAPQTKAFAAELPPAEVMQPLERVTDAMWPSAPVIPEMETGASDSVYTIAAGLPSYGISGVALDQDDVRAHGKDERVRVSSFYDGVEFYYRYLKALTGVR